jgi:Trp repressor protein.
MPHISKNKLSEAKERTLRERFIVTIGQIGRDKRTKHALRELFTYTESTMLAKRLGIIYMLSKDESTLDICEALNVSSSTVMRIGKIYDRGGYKTLENVLHRLDPSIRDIIETLMRDGIPVFGRGGIKRISKLIDKNSDISL